MELDFDGSFNYGRNTSKEELNSGFPLFSGILPLLNNGRVNLFGPNTPEITQEVRATNFIGKTFDSKLDGYGVNVKGSGEIYTLPAGPIALAVGMHAGKEKLSQNPNPILQTGDISGYGGNLQPIDNSRTVWAVFGEVNIPIVKTLEGNVAVRYDRYDDFGSTTNPKVSLRWQPTRKLLLRGAGGTGFLAPTLFQLYNPQTPGLSQPGISDPLRCPVNDPNNADCQTQYTATFGGNSSLKPQKAKQTTLGAIFEPVDGVSLAADWFDLDLEDIITNGVPIGTILDPATYGQYSGLVTRAASCAPTSGAPNLPCPITAIDQRFVNLGRVKVQGIDIDARFSGPATDLGRFGSYRRHVLHQVRPPAARRQFQRFDLQRFQAPASGITPRWKSSASLSWERGAWSATLANTHQNSYADVLADPDGNPRRVSTLSLWDVHGSYSGFKNVTLTLGAKNVFDRNPPVSNSNLTFQSGYDPSYYDTRARVVYGAVRYAFK